MQKIIFYYWKYKIPKVPSSGRNNRKVHKLHIDDYKNDHSRYDMSRYDKTNSSYDNFRTL